MNNEHESSKCYYAKWTTLEGEQSVLGTRSAVEGGTINEAKLFHTKEQALAAVSVWFERVFTPPQTIEVVEVLMHEAHIYHFSHCPLLYKAAD